MTSTLLATDASLQRDLLQAPAPVRSSPAPPLIFSLPDSVLAEVASFFDLAFCYRTLPHVCARTRTLVQTHSLLEHWSSGVGVLLRAADLPGASMLLRRARRVRVGMSVQTAFCDAPSMFKLCLALPHLVALQVTTRGIVSLIESRIRDFTLTFYLLRLVIAAAPRPVAQSHLEKH